MSEAKEWIQIDGKVRLRCGCIVHSSLYMPATRAVLVDYYERPCRTHHQDAEKLVGAQLPLFERANPLTARQRWRTLTGARL